MDDIEEVSAVLRKVAESLDFNVEDECGLYFLMNHQKDADESKFVELETIDKGPYATKKQLLENFLKSEYLYVPVKWLSYDKSLIHQMKITLNPFYDLSFCEAGIKADILEKDLY